MHRPSRVMGKGVHGVRILADDDANASQFGDVVRGRVRVLYADECEHAIRMPVPEEFNWVSLTATHPRFGDVDHSVEGRDPIEPR